MTTIDSVTLASVSGGAGGADAHANNLQQLENCENWAAKEHVGAGAKSAACQKEFVRQNWGNFPVVPGGRRIPL